MNPLQKLSQGCFPYSEGKGSLDSAAVGCDPGQHFMCLDEVCFLSQRGTSSSRGSTWGKGTGRGSSRGLLGTSCCCPSLAAAGNSIEQGCVSVAITVPQSCFCIPSGQTLSQSSLYLMSVYPGDGGFCLLCINCAADENLLSPSIP